MNTCHAMAMVHSRTWTRVGSAIADHESPSTNVCGTVDCGPSSRCADYLRRRAFTLVEMVIVIGIIVLLAALTFAVGVAVVHNSEVRQTQATISVLDAAVKEWEARADRKVSYGKPNEPNTGVVYEIEQPATPQEAEEVTKNFFAIISRTPSVREILAQVDPQFVEGKSVPDPNNPTGPPLTTYEFHDAWGKVIVAILPGRPWVANDPYARDADGTIRTEIELACGRTANRQICFLSPGPDGLPGDFSQPPDTALYAQTRDNIYSYTAPTGTTQP